MEAVGDLAEVVKGNAAHGGEAEPVERLDAVAAVDV